jgi:hypothetical protein
VVEELLAIFCLFAKLKLQSISGNHAATWWQNLAAGLSQLDKIRDFLFKPVIEQVQEP